MRWAHVHHEARFRVVSESEEGKALYQCCKTVTGGTACVPIQIQIQTKEGEGELLCHHKT